MQERKSRCVSQGGATDYSIYVRGVPRIFLIQLQLSFVQRIFATFAEARFVGFEALDDAAVARFFFLAELLIVGFAIFLDVFALFAYGRDVVFAAF